MSRTYQTSVQGAKVQSGLGAARLPVFQGLELTAAESCDIWNSVNRAGDACVMRATNFGDEL